jgi:hypothetical protein
MWRGRHIHRRVAVEEPGRLQREPAAVVADTPSAGYTGFVEIEILNRDSWDAAADQTAATVRQRFARLLA